MRPTANDGELRYSHSSVFALETISLRNSEPADWRHLEATNARRELPGPLCLRLRLMFGTPVALHGVRSSRVECYGSR